MTAHPSLQAAIARSSSGVLAALYPDAATARVLDSALHADELPPTGPDARHIDVVAGDKLGSAVAQVVLTRAATDGSSAADCPVMPPTPAS